MKYYSQNKQDEIIDTLLSKRKGFFVDIGANDGITFSNSLFFERERNWKGICIEPIKEVFANLQSIRKCVCLQIGIWKEKQTLKFYRVTGYSEMLSGLIDSYSSEHFIRLQREVEDFGGTLQIIEIEVWPLKDILDQYNVQTVDYCSIDTEGSEYEILSSIDFDRVHFKVFSIENVYNPDRIRAYLKEKGFRLIHHVGCDDIFISEKELRKITVKFRLFLFKFKTRYQGLFKKN